MHDSLEQSGESPQQFLDDLAAGRIVRVPGTAVFLTRFAQKIPPLVIYHVRHMGSLHNRVLTVTVEFEPTPRLRRAQRCEVEPIVAGMWHATVRYGFLEIPDLTRALQKLKSLDPQIDLDQAVYFASRDLIVRKPGHGKLSHWRLPMFAFLYRNAVKIVDRFNLPPRNVVEIARKIEV